MAHLEVQFTRFWQQRLADGLVQDVAAATGLACDAVEWRLAIGAFEARHALRMVEGLLSHGQRILEVGAGAGVLGVFLHHAGFDIHLLEPGGWGWEQHGDVFGALTAQCGMSPARTLRVTLEELDSSALEPFCLVFSNNVLEHVADLDLCLARMHQVLRTDGGVMVHGCPNYLVPYEPHFGVPLVPFRPRATARLLPVRVTSTPTWQTLNFVTAARIQRAAYSLGARVTFRPGLLADACARLEADPAFRERHPALARAWPLVRRFKLDAALRQVPPPLATPMVFEWRPALAAATLNGFSR